MRNLVATQGIPERFRHILTTAEHQFAPCIMCSIGLVLKCAVVHTLSLSDQVIKISQAVISF